jgi:hypothetical protein
MPQFHSIEEHKAWCYANSSEKGPWIVNEWSPRSEGGPKRVVLQSDDFCHDAALEISGDFFDHDLRLQYAHRLAARMNKMPPETKEENALHSN